MYKRILAAIDWAESPQAVLDQTRRLASLTGATVYVLHVQARNLPPLHSTLGYLASQALTTEPAGDASTAARRMVDDAVAALSAAGIHRACCWSARPRARHRPYWTRLWTSTSS